MDLSALIRAQQVARAPDLQIAHGDAEPGPQFVGLKNRVDALAGGLGDLVVVGQQQVCVSPVVAPANPAA